MGANRLMNVLSPSLMTTDSIPGTFFHRTRLGRWLTKTAWRYMSYRADEAAGFGGKAGNLEGLRPQIKDNRYFNHHVLLVLSLTNVLICVIAVLFGVKVPWA